MMLIIHDKIKENHAQSFPRINIFEIKFEKLRRVCAKNNITLFIYIY
jgi:hypothetical protein